MALIRKIGLLLGVAGLFVLLHGAHAQEEVWHEAYRLVDTVNPGLGPVPDDVNLATPQAAMENFMLAARDGDWEKAAHTLNLAFIPVGDQASSAPALAQRLHFIMRQNFTVPWTDLADRPDGVVVIPGSASQPDRSPHRAVVIGSADLGDRAIDVVLERVKPADGDAVWLISPHTVENIPALWQVYRPGPIADLLPDWANQRFLFDIPVWEWLSLPLLVVVSILGGIAANRLIERLVRHFENGGFGSRLIKKINVPLACAMALLLFYVLTFTVLTLTGPVNSTLRPMVVFATVLAFTWAAIRCVGEATDMVARRYRQNDEGALDDHTRDMLTSLSVARRVLIFIGFVIGLGVALIQVGLLDTVGFAMLGSAGVLTIIAGLAMRDVLSNIMAGMQIAITQPARIGDHVIFEDNWAYIEDITYTYVTIRTWDHRRIIIPIKYFLERPFENWSKQDPFIMMPITLHVDFHADIEAIRKKFVEIVEAHEDWDGDTGPKVSVTDVSRDTIELRAVCAADDPDKAWALHCDAREAIITWIAGQEGGAWLPRQRELHDTGRHSRSKETASDGNAADS